MIGARRNENARAAIAVVSVFVLVNTLIAFATGVRVGLDTGIYVDGGAALLQGQPLTARQPSYVGYIAFVALLQRLGLGLAAIVAGQLIAATVAAVVVFWFASALGGAAAGAVAVLFLTADVETNRWHSYVLSDSLFASALVIETWLVYRAAMVRRIPWYVVASMALLLTATIRPEGWFVVPVAAIYWIVQAPVSVSRRATALAVLLVLCGVLAGVVGPRLGGNVEAVGPGEMLRRGQTIWDYEGWRLPMPSDAPRDAAAGSGLDAARYATKHPVSTIMLMGARVAVHFAHVRPFFSRAHNLLTVAWLLPVYLCAALGVVVCRRQSLTRWCAMVLGSQTLVVALTHADWDGRYLAHVIALIYPFAGVGLVEMIGRLRGRTVGAPAIA